MEGHTKKMTPINVSNIDMKILLAQTGKLQGTSLTGLLNSNRPKDKGSLF